MAFKEGNTNSNTKDKLKLYVFNAPANLRYSVGSLNSRIKAKLDPMGNQDQVLTKKELDWSKYEKVESMPVKQGTVCSKCFCQNAITSSSASSDDINYYVSVKFYEDSINNACPKALSVLQVLPMMALTIITMFIMC